MARKDGAKRRTQIIEQAQLLFYTKGFENTSVNDIINAVGVSKGAFYHHFDSKQAVMLAVVDLLVSQTNDIIEPILEGQELNALQKFAKVLGAVNGWKLEQRDEMLAVAKVMLGDENHLFQQKMADGSLRQAAPFLAKIIEQGVEERIFDLGEIDQSHAAEIALVVMRHVSETFIRTLLATERPADAKTAIFQKYVAAQTTLERMLGAPAGSLPFIDRHTIDQWFA